jgi:hypothetical protein
MSLRFPDICHWLPDHQMADRFLSSRLSTAINVDVAGYWVKAALGSDKGRDEHGKISPDSCAGRFFLKPSFFPRLVRVQSQNTPS